ncbi:MAG: hypothetical protein ABGY11_01010 [Candidatus Thioglobus sp.]
MSFVAIAVVAAAATSAGTAGAANARAAAASAEQARINRLWAAKDERLKQEGNKNARAEVDRQLGAALTQLQFQFNAGEGTLVTKQADSNIYGNTAARQQNVLKMKRELGKDQLVQQAESKLIDVENSVVSTANSAALSQAQITQTYNNAMSQLTPPAAIAFSAISSGISAGVGVLGAGSSLGVVNPSAISGIKLPSTQ